MLMSTDEVFIYHVLYEDQTAKHITSDGKKVYFLWNNEMFFIEAPEDANYQTMSPAEIDKRVNNWILERMTTLE